MFSLKSCAIVASIVAAAATYAPGADVTWQLIDTGAPKVPTTYSASGFMDGYTGYILRLTSSGDPMSTFDFGSMGFGALNGTFAQLWNSSTEDALTTGNYDLFSPGVTTAKNSVPSLFNTDTHFLGSPSFVISNVVEDAQFSGAANSNPLASKSTDSIGFGTGSTLKGVVSFVNPYPWSTTQEIAYLVVPNSAPTISFLNAIIITVQNDGFTVSSPLSSQAKWAINGSGSWNDLANWKGGGVTDTHIHGPLAINSVPHVNGDVADFDKSLTNPAVVTLDGNKTISNLRLETKGPLTIAPGSGGALTFDRGIYSGGFEIYSGTWTIAVPFVLKTSLLIGFTSQLPAPTQPNALTFAGPISSDSSDPTDLNIRPGINVFFTDNNSYIGRTIIGPGNKDGLLPANLTVGDGGTNGTLGQGTVEINGILTFNRGDTYTLTNPITGTGQIVQAGAGTLILAGLSNFTGTTRILNGSLLIQGAGTFTDSGHNTINPGSTFSNWVTPQGSLANIGATSGAGLKTAANLRAGLASAQTTVSMTFRTRTTGESASLAADVVTITGMTRPATSQTDPFALEVTYDDKLLINESLAASKGQIFLGWLNDSNQWVNATDGNFDLGLTSIHNFQGSWSQFAAAFSVTDANLANFLGSWGVDTTGNTTWAVLNHNSQFSVAVPEPASLAFVSAGILLLLRARRVK